jgi:Trypsin-like peptidase domain
MIQGAKIVEERLDGLAELVERCTVRISHRDRLGTGFFVAPGLILTCAHVLGERNANKQKVAFRWNGVEENGTIERLLPDPCPEDQIFPDIALISHGLPQTPCVLLEAGYGEGDALYSWGYSSLAPAGESLSGICEGKRRYDETRDRHLIKFKGTQVLPGISGSPLLNRRTGAVCGIIKRTRDENNDIGGLAVRIQLLLELLPDVATKNDKFHEVNSVWRKAFGGRLAGERVKQERSNRGPKFVNRQTQQREFKTFWADASFYRPGAAQIYLLPSIDDDYPDLFTDRLQEDTVEQLARSFKGVHKAAIERVRVSQAPRYQNLEVLQRDLSHDLFTEFEALGSWDRSNPSATPLSRLERLRLTTFLVIEQTISVDSASGLLRRFLPWYFNCFWAGFCADSHVIVFLHLVWSMPKKNYDSWVRSMLLRRNPDPPSTYMELDDHLRSVLPAGEANLGPDALGAPVKRLSPLSPIESTDIQHWLRRLGVSPAEINPTIQGLFKDVCRKRGPEVRLG